MRTGRLTDDSVVRVCAALVRTLGRHCSRVGYDAVGRTPPSVTYLGGNKNISTQTATKSNLTTCKT